MKRLKKFFIRNQKRFIVAISFILIIIALINIYFTVNVNSISNDECLWREKKVKGDSIAIFFDLVKVEGVTWNAGIRDGNQLVAINDSILSGTFEATRILNRVKSGDFAKYTVRKDEKVFTALIKVKKLFFIQPFALGILGLFWMLIGFVVLIAKPEGTIQKLFYGIGAGSVLSTTYVILQSAFLDDLGINGIIYLVISYFWALSTCFLPFLIVYFFWIFPKQFKFVEKKWVKASIFVIPGILFIITFTLLSLTFVFNKLTFFDFTRYLVLLQL
ncbi:MAG TPA: hypothetical protein VLN45_08925, partial [Ignavibacteriaceae bacterium]|nr:hypothetical protein [Ignavibacteriaceae bacterium]